MPEQTTAYKNSQLIPQTKPLIHQTRNRFSKRSILNNIVYINDLQKEGSFQIFLEFSRSRLSLKQLYKTDIG